MPHKSKNPGKAGREMGGRQINVERKKSKGRKRLRRRKKKKPQRGLCHTRFTKDATRQTPESNVLDSIKTRKKKNGDI